ncbi:hypothetical protein KFE19_13015 [Dysosmobacter sp. Marseille-Q4140]|nr:hypothetical protein KFE19_13015 [Dysosmobacter sp. Marseille-Q4140]
MSRYDELRREKRLIDEEARSISMELKRIEVEASRASYIAGHAEEALSNIDREFEEATQLQKSDMAVLFLAIALQCVRQYFLTKFPERLDDQTAAQKVKTTEEHSNRGTTLYHPSLEEIISCPVPFDANIGSNGALAGGGSLGHRATAIGHDPVIGLVVGTANITTATLTTWDFQSYHIETRDLITKTGRNMGPRDCFAGEADTAEVFYHTSERTLHEGIGGKEAVCAALCKEIEHLRSDIGSTKSLPFPVVSHFSPKVASRLAEYGIDFGNVVQVSKQAGLSAFINFVITKLHGLLLLSEESEQDIDFFEARTRKILLYSNTIASASNLLGVGAAEAVAFYTENSKLAEQGLQYLDIGGLIVTTHRLISDRIFIRRIKQEFLENHWYETVMDQMGGETE